MPLYAKSVQWAETRRNNLIARKVVGEWIHRHTSPQAIIAMHSVGVVPFYAGRQTIDMWGLTDRYIAKTSSASFGKGMAGHEKTNPTYVFSRNPDIYIPEDRFFLPQKIQQRPEANFPTDFTQKYSPLSIAIEASWLNIWIRKDFALNKMNN
jgi:hypothetical protein